MGFWAYLRDRAGRIALSACVLGLVELMLAVYGLDWGAALACVGVLAVAGTVVLVWGYLRKRGFYRRLEQMLDGLEGASEPAYIAPELLERPRSCEEALFYDALSRESRAMASEVSAMRSEQREYRDYVETWVHEIKTPIAAARLVAANDPCPAADAMDAELARVEGYVEQALYYARSSSLDRDYQVRDVELADAVRSALRRWARTLIDARVTPELGELGFTVGADPKWLEFMLGQLFANAAKYVKPEAGGGHLRIWAERAETGLDAWETRLYVEDDGIGVPAADLARVWDRGFTGENGRRYARSTGMGLYLVRSLAAKMGLGTGVESEEGAWTRVCLAFPASVRRG